jgi:glucose/arabinose dehydrogenase
VNRSTPDLRTLTIALGAAGLVAASLVMASTAPPRCVAPSSAADADPVALVPMFGGLTFEKSVNALQHPTDPETWFVVLHRGVAERVRGSEVTKVFDISDRVEFGDEWGLQDFAFHPRFPADPRVFAAYRAPNKQSRVSVFRMAADGETVDAGSEVVLLSEQQAIPDHAVGALDFGPDGYLYIGWGEGGSKTADPQILRGKILRIDVDHTSDDKPYAIPADNPFIGGEVRPEAWAIGFRMPWRMSFDRQTGDLWVGDVGQHAYEQIDRVTRGQRYGWPVWEGTWCRLADQCAGPRPAWPVLEQSHSEMCAVIGGYVYRGHAIPELAGKYVYADACTGTMWAVDTAEDPPSPSVISRAGRSIGSFSEDRDGELYAVESDESETDVRFEKGNRFRVLKLVAGAAATTTDAASAAPLLSETGCIARGPTTAPAGLISYTINQPPWEDDATAVRFMTLGKMKRVWNLDVEPFSPSRNTLLMKTFLLDGRPIETQMLARRDDGRWDTFDYRWNADGSEAVALAEPVTAQVAEDRVWHFPGPSQCVRCHNTQVGVTRGLTVSQLNRDHDGMNQIDRLERFGTVRWPWKGGPLATMPRVDGKWSTLEERARAYLHVNCAHCHQPGGDSARVHLDMRRETPFALTGLCGKQPSAAFLGHEDALVIAPGDPAKSLVSIRMHAVGSEAMPPLRERVDPDGTKVVDEWIRSIRLCPGQTEVAAARE